jgi:hypothetical protein
MRTQICCIKTTCVEPKKPQKPAVKKEHTVNMKPLSIALAVCYLFGLTACAMMRDQAQVDAVVKPRAQLLGGNRQPISDYPRCSSSEWIARASNGAACPTAPVKGELTILASNMPPGSLDLRNAAQAELMTFSDLECKHHQAGIYSNQASVNFLSSLTALALTSASAVTSRGMGAGNTARNLAAGGSFFGASRGLINSEVYFSYIGPAVISEIDLNRKNARTGIIARQRCSIAAYPPARAINDALNYHETCSFVSGLSSLLRKAGVQQRDGDPTQGRSRNYRNKTAYRATRARAAALEGRTNAGRAGDCTTN